MPKKIEGLSLEQIELLLENTKGPGRPRLRDKWGELIWDALSAVFPDGLSPLDLREATGLDTTQLLAGARHLRTTVDETTSHPPVIYVPGDHKWFIAPSWGQHARTAIQEGYLQRAATMAQSATQLLDQAKEAFPVQAPRIAMMSSTAKYLHEQANYLVGELSAFEE